MALTKIDDRGLKTPIDLLDNEKIRFGTGNDLEIYHNGSNNYIVGASGQNTYIGATNGEIQLQPVFGSDHGIRVINNGSVELYSDGSKKFETYASGSKNTGNLWLVTDNDKALFGAGTDLQISHDGTDNIINNHSADLHIKHGAEVQAKFIQDGAVELYHDNSKRLSTTANGVQIDNYLLAVKAGSGSDAHLQLIGDNGAQNNDFFRLAAGNGMSTWDNYGSGSWVTNLRVKETGEVQIPNDTGKYECGSSGDLKIYHNGTHSFIANSTGQLQIKGDHIELLGNTAAEYLIRAIKDGAVELYYNNSKKIETDANGVTITGQCAVTSHVAWPDHSSGYVGKAVFGGGDDIQIYHDGTHSRICAYNTGNLLLKSQNDTKIEFGDEGGATELGLHATRNAGVDLYHNNSKVFETLGNGVRAQGGIMFGSDTADANRITDYEQGTWTPDPYHHSSIATQIGRYTKIGNMVYAYFSVTYYSSSSSQQYISNLPFVSVSGTGGTGGVARGYQNKDIQDGPIYSIGTNTNDLYFYRDNGVAFPASDGSGNSFTGTVVYQV